MRGGLLLLPAQQAGAAYAFGGRQAEVVSSQALVTTELKSIN
jgi:hypothetical protein